MAFMLAFGADTAELRRFSGVLGEAAQRMEDVITALAADGEQIMWVGPDADSFRAELDKVCLQGSEVAQQVRARGLQLETEADEQDAASAAGGSRNVTMPHGQKHRGPSRPGSMHKGLSPDPADVLDWVAARLRHLATLMNEKQAERILGESIEELLSPAERRLWKLLPVLGAIPDAIEAGQALGEGDTGAVIGNLHEAGLAAAPHPVAAVISAGNDLGDLVLPGDSSPVELLGELASHGDRVRMGEMTGSVISDQLGYEDGSLPDNVLTAGLGTLGHLSALRPHNIGAEYASAVRNWVHEQR